MTTRAKERAVVRAAMRVANVWLKDGGIAQFRGNNGLLVKMLRACARLAARAAGKKRGRG